MKLRTLDLIPVAHNFAPTKPSSDLLMLGYDYLCSTSDLAAWIDSDTVIDTPSRFIYAISRDVGVDIYTKPSEGAEKGGGE